MSDRELCRVCGAPLYDNPALRPDRLCPKHLAEARANTPPFADGKDAGATPGCHCDGPCPECPSGKPRKNCPICDGYGTLCCEFPCWQRVGLTSEPCCPSCAPLPEPEPAAVASVTPLRGELTARETTVREVARWLMHIDRLDEIPGAKAALPEQNPLWDAGVRLAEVHGVRL